MALIICFLLFSACIQESDTFSPTQTSVQKPLNQPHNVGKVRAIITAQLYRALGMSICYGSNTSAQVISSSEAYNILKSTDLSNVNEVMDYMDELAADPNAYAVRIGHIEGSSKIDYILIPNYSSVDDSILIDIGTKAEYGETCVSCTDSIGRVPPCDCSQVVKTECGQNPIVYCVNVCSWCFKDESSVNLSSDICNDSSPFTDPTVFNTLPPNSYL